MALKNKWYLPKAIAAVKNGGYNGLMAVGEIVGDAAQQITPLDTGELETSLIVQGNKKDLTVGIGFTKRVDGFDVATEQHENLMYNHLPGKRAKYLQEPFFSLGPGLLPYVLAEEIKKVLR